MEYIIKDKIAEQIRKNRRNREIARTVGVTEGYISQIVHKRPVVVKTTAYAITKAIDKDLEIKDVFEIS